MTTLKDTATTRNDDEVVKADSEASAEDQSAGKESTTEDETAQGQSEVAEVDTAPDDTPEKWEKREKRPIAWSRVLAYGVLPGLALLLALTAGYLNWSGGSAQDSAALRDETVRIASEDAVALLSYHAASVEKDLGAARERLTGDFKDAYTSLTREVVIPGAKEKHVSAVAKAAAGASVSATDSHAVVLVFVNQTVTVGEGVPTDTAPVVRVVLDKVNGRWLVSHFDPV
jgi:Mce-associated membrane protein